MRNSTQRQTGSELSARQIDIIRRAICFRFNYRGYRARPIFSLSPWHPTLRHVSDHKQAST